jgi:hypothetical protein
MWSWRVTDSVRRASVFSSALKRADGDVGRHMVAAVRVPGVDGVDAAGDAPVRLGELVAVQGVVHVVGEVGPQAELVADQVGVHLGGAVGAGLAPHAGQAVAARFAAVGAVDRIEAADAAVVHGALRNLVGRIPAAVVGHGRHAPAVVGVAAAVAQHAVQLAVIVAAGERAVVVQGFQRIGEGAAGGIGRCRHRRARVAVLAQADGGDVARQPVGIGDVGAAGGGEIAVARRIRALAVIEARGQFRDQEVQVGPALAVRVAALVDRHVVDEGSEVGAVVEVEAAQVELVGLAFAAVLAGDQAGRRFQQFAGAVDGAHLQLFLADAAHVGRIGDAELAGARAFDQHALNDRVVGKGTGVDEQRGQRAAQRFQGHLSERSVGIGRH